MIDVWASAGVNVPSAFQGRAHNTEALLPMDEDLFLSLRPSQHGVIQPLLIHGASSSLLTQMIKLNRILLEVQQINERAVNDENPESVQAMVLEASWKLDDWHSTLPTYMQDTAENLARYASKGHGGLFLAVYLGYYHYGQLLYYQYLHANCDQWETPLPNVQLYAARCKAYAAHLCDMLYRAEEIPGLNATWTMLGHVLVVASTVQIHTLLFDESEEQIMLSRIRLERNFEILTRLRRYWPTLDIVFTRLRAFHKACHTLRESSFKMDKWLLKFLHEFAKPMDDRDIEETPSASWLMM